MNEAKLDEECQCICQLAANPNCPCRDQDCRCKAFWDGREYDENSNL